eukprot:CAMPEP_0198305060 /NCGR_PEP_ID=MMETSP1449-20131203/57715_1 /TAXON_ID=420275 /ORGANISM="Attheya septentrionalis, Strain CCMP2084" /LENGTH=416 /DNA_ID=CAMNT_0044007591 /DNA_START=130 /DNA_END=1380 /DNA_ORIENTATION=-
MSEQTAPHVVSISYEDLVNASSSYTKDGRGKDCWTVEVLEKIGRAYGEKDSLGILAVTGVPGLKPLRQSLLPLARQLALSSDKVLESVTDVSSGYQVGWSHGKERVEGKFDLSKGSFYANPLTDNLLTSTLERSTTTTATTVTTATTPTMTREEWTNIAHENPAFFAPNVCPPNGALPDLEPTVKEMGKLVCNVGKLVAQQCDAYVSQQSPGYETKKIETIITDSLCCKARLLHYFARDENNMNENKNDESQTMDDMDFSDWCGWHNDHGSLTGLVPGMFLDENGEEVSSPDPKAGLYYNPRNGTLVHVKLPPDSLGFQIGETSQIHSGGLLKATPHAVRGAHANNNAPITRESFAVFMEPEYFGDMTIPPGRTVQDTQGADEERHLPKTVKTLDSRWKAGMNFGEFSNATFAAFY